MATCLTAFGSQVNHLGPEGGEAGGHVVFEGTPEGLVRCEDSYTARFLRPKVLHN